MAIIAHIINTIIGDDTTPNSINENGEMYKKKTKNPFIFIEKFAFLERLFFLK
jgi:hypothetical protein